MKERLTSHYQGNDNERCVPGEEIEHLEPVPRGMPNVFHFLRQDQKPIVELWAVKVIIECSIVVESEITPPTWIIMAEAVRGSYEKIGCHGYE